MSNTNEFKKILSAVSALGFGGAGIASLFTAGIAPLAWGSAAFVLAGISGCNLLATDKIDLLEEQNQEITAQIADLRSQLNRITAERDNYKSKLETEVAGFKVRCQELQDGIEYWKSWPPEIMDAPPVRELVGNLRGKLKEVSQQLESALAEIAALKAENTVLREKVTELENLNDELDGDLASKLLELAQLKTNFDYKLRDELHSKLQPYCNQAVSVAVEKKLAEIDRLKQAIAMLQEDIGNYQEVMDGLEKSTLPDIEKTYKSEMSEADSKLMQLAGQNELLQQKIAQLEAPQQFPGITYADSAGNRVINHFAQHGVLFDAHDASVIPGGFCLRFRVARNADKTKLSGEEFDKLTSQCGLMGISTQPIHFKLDPQNLMISVEVFSGIQPVSGTQAKNTPDTQIQSLSTVGSLLTEDLGAMKRGKKSSQQGIQESYVRLTCPDIHRQKFVDLGCFPADQFGQVVREKFVDRVRVCAGSTGGKSPLAELIAVEIAQANKEGLLAKYKAGQINRQANSIIWLVNPIPCSPKDWFRVPGIIQPGTEAEPQIEKILTEFHDEFKRRRKDLAEAQNLDYIHLLLDEDNSTAREYEYIGKLLKDLYQLSDHVNMGITSAGQGNNVSGLSGATPKPKEGEKNTGNANKLFKEDFQNCTKVYTAEQARVYLGSNTLKNRIELLEKLSHLEALCNELNELECLKSRPKIGEAKKVNPAAYRVALVVSPAVGEPFFIQIPAYSSFSLEGLCFPTEARVTSPHRKEKENTADVLDAFVACTRCLSQNVRKEKKLYADGTPKFYCRDCRHIFGNKSL